MQLSRTRVELVRESRFATGGAISFSLVRILRRQWQFRQLATADDFLESLPCVNCRGQHPPELAATPEAISRAVFLTEWDNPVAYPGCIPVAALERFLLVLVIFDNAERHSRGGLDTRTAEMRERKW